MKKWSATHLYTETAVHVYTLFYNFTTRNFRHDCLHFMNKLTVHVIIVP